MYVCFMDLEKALNRVNREALGENEDERRVVDFFVNERGLSIGNMYFKHRKVTRGWDELQIINMIDLLLVKRGNMKHVHDMKTEKEMEQSI